MSARSLVVGESSGEAMGATTQGLTETSLDRKEMERLDGRLVELCCEDGLKSFAFVVVVVEKW